MYSPQALPPALVSTTQDASDSRTSFFVIAFTTFLTSCIDYSKLAHSVSGPNSVGKLEDALVGQCLTRGGFWHMSFILLFAGAFIYRLTTVVASIPGLLDMHGFYTHLLGIPDVSMRKGSH